MFMDKGCVCEMYTVYRHRETNLPETFQKYLSALPPPQLCGGGFTPGLDNNGLDMYDEISVLSTYMGHENIYGTEHYLHMTAENSRDILDKVEKFNKGLFPEVPE